MRKFIMLAAIALVGCQAEPQNTTVAAPEDPMGSGPLQKREFAMPLLGMIKMAGTEAVLKFDSAKNQIYFGSNNRGKVTEDTMPFATPDLMNTAGRMDTPKYLIQLSRTDCKSDHKELGGSTILASVSPKAFPETNYAFCMVSTWPKDLKKPSWSKVPL